MNGSSEKEKEEEDEEEKSSMNKSFSLLKMSESLACATRKSYDPMWKANDSKQQNTKKKLPLILLLILFSF